MNYAIQKICEVASLPFFKLRTSDELRFVPKLSDFLNSFKYQSIYPFPFRRLLINPNQKLENENNIENLSQLRYTVIKFMKSFAEEGVSEIMK